MAALVLPPKAQIKTEDLFIVVYCCVDEHYHLLFGSQSALRQSNNSQPAFTDAEVITIALVGELMGEDSQKAWHGKVSKNWRKLFPLLCDRTRYGRRLRRLRVPTCLFRRQVAHIQQHLCFLLGTDTNRYRIVPACGRQGQPAPEPVPPLPVADRSRESTVQLDPSSIWPRWAIAPARRSTTTASRSNFYAT